MDGHSIQTYIDKIKYYNPDCDEDRLSCAYEDINCLEVMWRDIIDNKISECNSWDFAKEGLLEEAKHLHFLERQLSTLLRSLYLIASTFITILLYDCNYRTKDDGFITITSIYSSKTSNTNKSDNQIRKLFECAEKAFFIQMYRNNYIAHNKIPMSYSTSSGFSSGATVTDRLESIKLLPIPLSTNNEYDTCIELLCDKYKLLDNYQIPPGVNPCEIIAITSDLFYKVPLYIHDTKNIDDRNSVRKIADYIACYSMTFKEVIQGIDDLIIGLCTNFE